MMDASISAPLHRQIKSWQLVCLGISGWVTLYSAAIISWGASSFVIGNAQGGSFAAVMALAGSEVKRRQKGSSDLLQWAGDISTEQLNLALTKTIQKNNLLLEAVHPVDAEMGFGLRAVKAGRTFLFETGRWKEPVIDLLHAKTTEENRNKSNADFAVIVGAGTPDEDTKIFASTHPVKLLVGKDLKDIFTDEKSAGKSAENIPNLASALSQFGTRGEMAAPIEKTGAGDKSTVKNEKPVVKAAKPSGKAPGAPISNLRVRINNR
jgi:hypothetical protein